MNLGIEDCLTCPEHGHCSMEYMGGESKVMTALEMDAIMGGMELGQNQLAGAWEAKTEVRKQLGLILTAEHDKGHADYLISESPEGVEYFRFALRQLAVMESIIETVHPIFAEAKQRADDVYAARGSRGN